MKKVLCDFQNTIGGAPRSHLEHAKALRKIGYEIVAVISKESKTGFFDKTDFKVYYLPEFEKRNVSRNIWLLKEYRDIIKSENIDLIYANRVAQCQFLSILSDLMGIPILNARAGGNVCEEGVEMIRIHNDKPYIVYSEENLESFLKAGFKEEDLYLVRNRLKEPKAMSIADSIDNNNIVITLTGSIKEDTLVGVTWFLKFLTRIDISNALKITVNLAGGDILKSKKDKELFEQTLHEMQQKTSENVQIKHLGWVDEITELQGKSHICIGKGRSIIEPAMMGKICFVISESEELYRCKQESYSDLLFYNFSGRGTITQHNVSKDELEKLLAQSGQDYQNLINEADKLKERFKKDYSVNYLPSKLDEIIDSIIKNKCKIRLLRGLVKFSNIYMVTALNKIINK